MYNIFFGIVFYTLLVIHASAEINNKNTAPIEQALSGDHKTHTLTDKISSQVFTPTGETTFSILFWDLYTSKLFTTSGRYPISPEDEALILHINYLADISRDDLIMRTVEQWQHLGVKEEQYQHFVKELKNLWPDITDGDSLALLIEDDKSVFYFNDLSIGAINDPEFGPLFVDIWLSENTSQPALRAELLGDSYNE